MFRSASEAEIKVRVRRNPRRALRKIIILLIALYTGFLGYRFGHDLIITRLAGVEQVRLGVIQSSIPAHGILVRSEKVVAAPHSGKLKVLAAEGERVRVGEVVAQVVTESLDKPAGETVFNLTAPWAGIISYHLDGLEEIYSPENIRELDLPGLEQVKSKPEQFTAGSPVEAGRPVLKIVNNLEPLYLIAFTENDLALPEKNKKNSLYLSFSQAEKELSQAVVQERNFRGRANQVLFSLNYQESLAVPRKIELQVITDRFEGYVVPAGAIVQKEGKAGIYTVFKERVRWKKVEITGRAQEKVVISGITPDIKVILNPEYVKEGYPFKLP